MGRDSFLSIIVGQLDATILITPLYELGMICNRFKCLWPHFHLHSHNDEYMEGADKDNEDETDKNEHLVEVQLK